MTSMPLLPLDEGYVRLGRVAELLARNHDDTTADDIMEAFKRAIFAGEMGHENVGLQMEIAMPRCTLPPVVAAMSVRPRDRYGANRCTVASVLMCADALPGERVGWERLFDICDPDYDGERPYVTLIGIPYRDYPEAGRREMEALLVSKSKFGNWLAARDMPARPVAGPSPTLAPPLPEPRAQGRPHKPTWPRIVQLVRQLHRDHPDWQKKRLAYEAWTVARQEFPEDHLPSIATIQRDMVQILGGGSA